MSTQESVVAAPELVRRPGRGRRFWAAISPKRISAIYAFIVIFIVFAIWTPSTFLSETTLRTILDQQAITAILAIGLTVPLASGVFDLSVGYTLGLSTILVSVMLTQWGVPIALAVLIAILAGAVVGLVSGFIVTRLGVDSFITTLGMGSVAFALTLWLSNNQLIIGLPQPFQKIATTEILGIQLPVYYMVILALILWYVMAHTPAGRYFYAAGGNYEAARLSGLPTQKIVVASLVIAGLMAGIAGTLLAGQSAAGSPSVAPQYLLPAFAAVFLGSTQFRSGTPNIWGTVISVYVLATGVKGLQLVGAPFWIPDLFNGVVLIIAVALSKDQRSSILRRFRRRPVAAAA